MNEVHVGVGLQKVAPGALAGMRLAGYQQHAQLVTHAVDGDDGAVVDGCQFALERSGFDLDDVWAGMRDLDLRAHGRAGLHGALVDDFAVAADGDLSRSCANAGILDLVDDGLLLVDDSEARRGDQGNAAITFVRAAGNQRVQRRGKAKGGSIRRHVMDAAIGEHDCASNAIRRHVGQRGTQG